MVTAARQRLSRPVVVAAALELIDAEGLGALSMRRVGQALRVEAMSLYRYVQSREALLDAVADSIVDDLWDDPQVQSGPDEGWREYLSRLAYGVRRFAIAHPRAFSLVATRPPAAPFVRPPLRSLRWLEGFLTALRAQGFNDEDVLYTYRAFTSFLLGHLLLETGARCTNERAVDALPTGPLPPDAPNIDTADPDDPGLRVRPGDMVTTAGAGAVQHERYPVIGEFAVRLAQNHAEQEFTDGLHDLLDRLAARSGADATT